MSAKVRVTVKYEPHCEMDDEVIETDNAVDLAYEFAEAIIGWQPKEFHITIEVLPERAQ